MLLLLLDQPANWRILSTSLTHSLTHLLLSLDSSLALLLVLLVDELLLEGFSLVHLLLHPGLLLHDQFLLPLL